MTSTHFGLFPTPIGSYDLERDFTDRERDYMRLCLQDLISNEGNSASRFRQVLDSPELVGLRSFCTQSLTHFTEEVVKIRGGLPDITQSWLTLSRQGQWHHKHSHPNSMWSGVLYVSVGETDHIKFHDPSNRFGSFRYQVHDWNHYNSDSWWLPTRPGQLLLFPASLVHSAPPTESDERISLAFNTFASNPIGDRDELTELELAPRNA